MTCHPNTTESVDDLCDDLGDVDGLELFELFAEIADDLDTGADDERDGLELFELFAEVCGQVFEVERMHIARMCGARVRALAFEVERMRAERMCAAGQSVADVFDWPRTNTDAAGLPS